MDSPTQSKQPGGRLLLCNIGRLGDTIIRNSILDAARATYAHIDYICSPAVAELLCADDRIDSLHVFRNNLAGFQNLFRATLKQHHDAHLDLKDHDSTTSLLIATFCRASLKIGCNRSAYRPFHRNTAGAYSRLKNRYTVMRSIARIAGLNAGDFAPRVRCTTDSRQWFTRQHPSLNSFVLINISATVDGRMWPSERWVELLHHPAFSKTQILVNALPKHHEFAQSIIQRTHNAITLQPRHVMDVAAAVEQSAFVITVDTGVTQLAAALNRPSIVLYASRAERTEYNPGGARNDYLVPDIDADLATLSSQSVAAAFQRFRPQVQPAACLS